MENSITTRDDTVVLDNAISLKQFSPILRKLGKFLLKSDHPLTISVACDELNLNKESVYSSICRSRRNGNDFNRFIDEHAKSILHANKLAVYDRLIEGAVSDSSTSHNDRKTYLHLTGDLKEDTNITVNNLTIGINISGARPADTQRPKGTIDVTPIIPDDD